ncbi:hypothetical protein RKE29_13170 [Streptomyces sp. B1866]|uniref:hypothetical protein n=1 Tax=Streptomyces sp. B1866 TaxID=3075431 RepID=UPI00288FF69E|nr:hypothetical protein [Streptomyces sp. B1866]MDT3397590.1 hypothetical protein [Streptomyces sp. B1866]
MVQAKPELKARARELRRAGKTYDEIVTELGVSKSSVSPWVRDLPKPPTPPARLRRMIEARWAPHRRATALRRLETKLAAAREIGRMTDRELFLVGVGLYWAEGTKSRPYRPKERVAFINSDPEMIQVYLAWLSLLGVAADRLRFYVMIHESADVGAAERYWADLTGMDAAAFGKTTLKRHNPKTVRKNVGEDYHGCLVVHVLDGADLYRRIEGWWYGIVVGAKSTV